MPIEKARAWMAFRQSADQPPHPTQHSSGSDNYGTTAETTPLSQQGSIGASYFASSLGQSRQGYGTARSTTAIDSDADDENEPDSGYISSEDFPVGYEAHHAALPSINDQ